MIIRTTLVIIIAAFLSSFSSCGPTPEEKKAQQNDLASYEKLIPAERVYTSAFNNRIPVAEYTSDSCEWIQNYGSGANSSDWHYYTTVHDPQCKYCAKRTSDDLDRRFSALLDSLRKDRTTTTTTIINNESKLSPKELERALDKLVRQ